LATSLRADPQWAAPAQLLVEVVSAIRGKALGRELGRHGAAEARLVCYSAQGFTEELHQAADQDDAVALVTLDDLY
jgi:hypothetical protein